MRTNETRERQQEKENIQYLLQNQLLAQSFVKKYAKYANPSPPKLSDVCKGNMWVMWR